MTDTPRDWEERADELAVAALDAGTPSAWFEQLYAEGRSGRAELPWDRTAVNPQLAEWAHDRDVDGGGLQAAVVGAGLGADAAYIAGIGYQTVAFDISETAVQIAAERFGRPGLRFVHADLLALPDEWRQSFDLVVEIFTVQALPRWLRAEASGAVAGLVAESGTLLVVATSLGATDDPDEGPPWPLTEAELGRFAVDGLEPVEARRVPFAKQPGSHRWVAELRRSGRPAAADRPGPTAGQA